MKYADAANRPFTTEQILDNALLCILKTGQFKEACREWRHVPNQSWTDFKKHFALAHKEYREMEALAESSGYSANQVITQEASNEIINHVNHINEETRTMVQYELNNVLQRLSQLEAKVQKLTVPGNPSNPPTPANDHTSKKAERDAKLQARFNDPDAYCWSHGFTGSNLHTSSTCRTKLQGHQDDATKTDMKGGNKEQTTGFFKALKYKK